MTFCANRSSAIRLRRRFPSSLHNEPMLLPTSGTALRRTLEKWFQEQGIHPRVVAEFDDAALIKVAAADGLGCFPLPTAALDEAVTRYGFRVVGGAKGCTVQFYAISAERKLTHPAVVAITSNARGRLFCSGAPHGTPQDRLQSGRTSSRSILSKRRDKGADLPTTSA